MTNQNTGWEPGEAESIVSAVEAALPALAAKVWARHPNNPVNREANERLDRIAEALGTGSAEALNTVHACRPGHPWNRNNAMCFRNLEAILDGRYIHGLGHEDRNWVSRMAATEREG